ncbi:helix-hairpin-helix domain-containing protein [Aquipseudomonas guryensis]|uniref:Helix-hairpin-helix domain-containing protein n=1 Tax=Aquipseudomonas guryensis TaxID=2759165 RepID=A0A7W4DEM3_9GAMM|nr:helix-hairpin-helix domain-containing protein [Pseudomonas guryensis]MBB1521193.1 helix-hairpin-helix domain-containing protein [Pseudomonas guryensis]
MNNQLENSSLILAAEDCPPDQFSRLHYFSKQEQKIISKLIAHGPVLLKGARGSGKSALMIEASRNMYPDADSSQTFGIYLSLRHLALIRSEGEKYEKFLCQLLLEAANSTIKKAGLDFELNAQPNTTSIQKELSNLSSGIGKRIVILFDDAAHIGRETPLHEFFDIFRTISNSVISCKAAIYPGVTRFGNRFDVYNDATVIDVSKSDDSEEYNKSYAEIFIKRFPNENPNSLFTEDLDLINTAGFLGRAVLGNMRGYIFACNKLADAKGEGKIGLGTLTKTLIDLSANYYWPLIEEVIPKLGIYAPMAESAIDIANVIFSESASNNNKRSATILREIAQRLAKPLEILEYTGFISIRDISRAMKSRGRGTRYILNLCTLLEKTHGARITGDLFSAWQNDKEEPVEFHKGSELYKLELPELSESGEMLILSESIEKLRKSNIYPYGLTDHKIDILLKAGYKTVSDLADANDVDLLKLDDIGEQTLKRIKSTVAQAIWM